MAHASAENAGMQKKKTHRSDQIVLFSQGLSILFNDHRGIEKRMSDSPHGSSMGNPHNRARWVVCVAKIEPGILAEFGRQAGTTQA